MWCLIYICLEHNSLKHNKHKCVGNQMLISKLSIYSAIKQKEILPFATWADLEGIMLTELGPTKKRDQSKSNLQIQRTDWWSSEAQG